MFGALGKRVRGAGTEPGVPERLGHLSHANSVWGELPFKPRHLRASALFKFGVEMAVCEVSGSDAGWGDAAKSRDPRHKPTWSNASAVVVRAKPRAGCSPEAPDIPGGTTTQIPYASCYIGPTLIRRSLAQTLSIRQRSGSQSLRSAARLPGRSHGPPNCTVPRQRGV